MKKFAEWIQKKLMPVAQWVGRNQYLQVLSQTFISLLPVIIIGAFALILSKSPVTYTGFEEGSYWYNFFKVWTDWTNAYMQPLKFVNSATLGALSLWVTVGIAYRWARKYDLDIVSAIITAVVNFIVVNSIKDGATWSTSYFGGEGLFSAIFTAFLTVQLYRYLTEKGFGKVKFADSVPGVLSKSMSSILPMFVCMALAALIVELFTLAFGISIPAMILSIGKPLNVGIDTPWGLSLVTTLGQFSWWFGIHNSAILSIFSPLLYSNLAANAEAYAAGVAASQLPYIVNQAFFYNLVTPGGAGATFGLVLLLLRSKSETLKSLGKVSIVPSLFGINEPVIYGLPIMMNITMLIPFLIANIVNIFVGYYAILFNLVNRPMFYMGGTSPVILNSILCNMDFRSALLWIALVAIDIVIYYPFFKIVERDKLAEEKKLVEEDKVENAELSAE